MEEMWLQEEDRGAHFQIFQAFGIPIRQGIKLETSIRLLLATVQ
jgi:hypothetical protein